ncbi:Predicted amidohydrolase [Kaistella treverensis]|uniref:Omega-amidase YafV n=1 Tax=Kaistella treverensis TaxID=631455 RepID=A0A1I3LQ63_9FLAO|nr:amidohydrolase [Kaistella treverensis]SFI86857.1 Predicted amidohydrolase [Kaistella treverensis]
MNNLKISAPHFDIIWKDKNANFRNIEEKFAAIQADILVLPEMFSTGFYMQAEEIADQKEETLNWMRSFAKEKNIAVCGSASVKENKRFVNRFYFVEPSGEYQYYDKRHLFSYSGEDKTYSAGSERIIVSYNGWRILLQVCYDLRFPVFSRNNGDYDAIFYVANWPSTRIDAWKTLLKARAIENQSYVLGVNRIGIDGNNLEYPESSYCFFADGEEISSGKNGIFSANLDSEKLQKNRQKFPFLSDRDEFKIL